MEVAGPLGTPLGLAQRKRASPRGEAGTSGFLSVSVSDRRVPAELGHKSELGWCVKDRLTEDVIQTLTLTPGSLESNPTSNT